jgi:acetolactate decarboxylase
MKHQDREILDRIAAAARQAGLPPLELLDGLLAQRGGKAPMFLSGPLNALIEGVFSADLTVAELKKHGDFGIGTFNALDGEMVMLDGVVYQIRSDGAARRAGDADRTPFACVAFHRPDSKDQIAGDFHWEKFSDILGRCLPSPNMLYAIRVDGLFKSVKTRSVPKQECSRPLVEIAREQPVFSLSEIRGTLVGFYNPPFIAPINAPGLHLHFIDERRQGGGHLLECSVIEAEIGVQHIPGMTLGLPLTFDYLTADLTRDVAHDIHEAESDR